MEDEVGSARRVVEAFEKGQDGDAGAIQVDGKVVDIPIVERAPAHARALGVHATRAELR